MMIIAHVVTNYSPICNLHGIIYRIKIHLHARWAFECSLEDFELFSSELNSNLSIYLSQGQGVTRLDASRCETFLPDSFRRVRAAVVATVARHIAATRTARGVRMAATISKLSNSSKSIRRRLSAVRVSVKSASVIAREITRTGSPVTTREGPRDRAGPSETVVTSVTLGASRARRRRNTWDSIVIPWWTVLRVWMICVITWPPLPSARGRRGMPSPGWSRVGCSPFTGRARPTGVPPSARWTLIKVSFRVSRAELAQLVKRTFRGVTSN